MFERILKLFRERVRAGCFVVTLHAVEELEDEGFSVFDVEQAILGGRITRRQRDEDTGEWKYLVRGHTQSREEIVVVAN
jgi:hypothetical protein